MATLQHPRMMKDVSTILKTANSPQSDSDLKADSAISRQQQNTPKHIPAFHHIQQQRDKRDIKDKEQASRARHQR